jgi:hypothetical protein
MQQSAMLYLGFRIGPDEFHLRNTLAWLTEVKNARRHLLVLRAKEVTKRAEELDALRAVPQLSIVPFDSVDGDKYRFLTHLAGVCAPRADGTGSVAERIGGELAPGYVLPALVPKEEGDDLERLRGRSGVRSTAGVAPSLTRRSWSPQAGRSSWPPRAWVSPSCSGSSLPIPSTAPRC